MIGVEITDVVIRCGLTVNNILGYGHSWDVYREAFFVELEDNRLKYEHEKAFPIKYKGKNIGEVVPDIVVENKAIVQIYSLPEISPAEEEQIKNYMRTSGMNIGVILNFGPTFSFKKFEF